MLKNCKDLANHPVVISWRVNDLPIYEDNRFVIPIVLLVILGIFALRKSHFKF